jgi:4-amino-4-deoxy-L-arabinose transferase-like glycosyltransferase
VAGWRTRWSGAAWAAAGLTALFVAITCWWLARDAAVPFGGGAAQLYASVLFHDAIAAGDPLRIFEQHGYYPPGVRLLGALALFAGGMRVAAPILAQNLVFVPLLALGCYRTGRLTAGPRAGLLAVVFALGSPLIAEQLHVFMLDAPQAALIAVAAWLILASERFACVELAAAAGLTVGLGLLVKQYMPLYLVGLLAAVLTRGGGWRNRRGIAAFLGVALIVAGPWYLRHAGEWGRWVSAAGTGSATEPVPPAASPPLLSLANLTWYGWATLNALLFAGLSAFAAIGVTVGAARVARARGARTATSPAVELLCGLGGAWLAITLTRHHDARYTMGLIVYLAVLGTAWIVRLGPARQALAIGLLVLAVGAAQLGATFGVGRTPNQMPLSNGALRDGEGVPPRDRIVVYSSLDYLVSGPQRSGDVGGLFAALRRAGATRIAWVDRADVNDHLFDAVGLISLARFAGLKVEGVDAPGSGRQVLATVARLPAGASGQPCRRLANGTGLRVRLGGRDWCA